MAKRKITPEILEAIELCAADEYTVDKIREEANIIRPLMKDPQVQEAIERGRLKWFVEIVATDGDLDSFMYYSGKTMDEIGIMFDTYKESIRARKSEVKQEIELKAEDKKKATRQFSCPMHSGMINILEQLGEGRAKEASQQVLYEDLTKMVEKTQHGDTEALITLLTTNVMQLQSFNGVVTRNLMGDAGKQLDNFQKLSNMQLKVMQEIRKSIMAINEICNPKRTAFIKEANQYNHHYLNSEKKDKSENEKQIEHKEVTEAEVYDAKETVHENE